MCEMVTIEPRASQPRRVLESETSPRQFPESETSQRNSVELRQEDFTLRTLEASTEVVNSSNNNHAVNSSSPSENQMEMISNFSTLERTDIDNG